MNAKQGLFIGILFAFLIMGFISMERAMPNAKEDRIYKAIKVYSPYQFEKYMGGLAIVDKRDGFKEKPDSAEVLLRMDELDQKWGKDHLKIVDNSVVILGENNQSITKIHLQTPQEKEWVQKFFGI